MTALCFTAMALMIATASAAASRHNVLMLAVDDLRPELACTDLPGYHKPRLHTPNICSLAQQSLVLQRSQVAMATCSPSRTALLTGRHPGTTHVWDLYSYFHTVDGGGSFTTIPQHFKQKGYKTIGMGKIFHPGHASGGDDKAYSWTEPYFHGTNPVDNSSQRSWEAVPEAVTSKTPLQDTQVANHAVATLQQIGRARRQASSSQHEYQKFFLAVGFHKPHLPFVFPEAYLDLYPPADISLPSNPYAPAGMPTIAWQKYGETRNYADVKATGATGDINTTLPDSLVLSLRRAYYAAVSYTDDNIGLVLTALSAEGLANETIVTFWGDHGWHLGEHGEWDKHTNFALNTHAPLMFRVPGLTTSTTTTLFNGGGKDGNGGGGIVSYQLTETVDIFPSLVDFALGETLPTCPEKSAHIATCTEGTSVRPLIAAPEVSIKLAAFSVYPRGYKKPSHALEEEEDEDEDEDEDGVGVPSPSSCLDKAGTGKGCTMGYSMMTRIDGTLLRYTEWVHFPGPSNGWRPKWDQSLGTELYNHSCDAAENANVFESVKGTHLAKELHTRLKGGWPAAAIKTNA